MLKGLLFAALSGAQALSFPESGNPQTAEPPLVRPNTKSCVASLFEGVQCSSWDEVTSVPFTVPEDCAGGQWSEIILDVKFSENGTQYDRFGAMWLGEVELLRTTTAEPTADGIVWTVEKDVTIYGDYILSTPDLKASVAIPNNIDDTYTGIIQVDASLTFYTSSDLFPAVPVPRVQPLTAAPSSSNPFDAMTVAGNQSLSYSVSLAVSDVDALFVDVFASAHGCEEFYYTNVPSDSEEAASLGICGGGVYREIQVFVDGAFAGAAAPFPVVYTGGINPFLWRPLTGIMSFDIPSHRLDISPFLAVLADGQAHSISFTVYNNDVSGYWYLDASLLYARTEGSRILVGGILDLSEDTGADVTTATNRSSPSVCFHTVGDHSYAFSSTLQYDDGYEKTHTVKGHLHSDNENCIIGSTLMKTAQISEESIDSSVGVAGGLTVRERTLSRYPLAVESYYKQDETTMDMQATLLYSYNREKSWVVDDSATGEISEMSLSWSNSMASNATYNRTLDHTTVYAELGKAEESYTVSQRPWTGCSGASDAEQTCFRRHDSAEDGYISRDNLVGVCHLPATMSFCGYDVCGSLLSSGYQRMRSATDMCSGILGAAKDVDLKEDSQRLSYPTYEYTSAVVRHPLAELKQQQQ